jgi:hypothetical protein
VLDRCGKRHRRCWFWRRGRLRGGLSGCTHRFDDRIDVLRVKGGSAQEFNERGAQQGRAVVNQVRLLSPSGEVEVVSSAVVGKRKAVQVQLGHQQTCNTRQHKRPAAESQEALSKARGHHETESNGAPPHGLQLLKQVEMGMGISGYVLFDQRHTDVQPANTVRVVPRFNDAHQFVVHDERCRFQSAAVLTERKFDHVFTLKRKDWRSPNRQRPSLTH